MSESIIKNNNSRLSNLELLRLVCMIMVVFLHLNTYTIGSITQQEIVSTPFVGFFRTLAKQVCIIAVDVFILISGWFGIKANFKGFLKLMFQVFFYGIILLIPSLILGPFNVVTLVKVLLGGVCWWFIPAYVILYLLSPVLNVFVEQSNGKQLGCFVLMFFVVEFVYGWIGCVEYEDGCSALSFMGLYLLARWLRLHAIPYLEKYSSVHFFIIYMIITFVASGIAFLGVKFIGYNMKMYAYCNPLVILAAVSFFLAFARFSIKPNRLINWCSKSALAIYLIHMHPAIQLYWREWFSQQYILCRGGYIILVFVSVVLYAITCILIDKIRIFLWNRILTVNLRKFGVK